MRVNLASCVRMVCTKMQRVCLREWISRVQEGSWIMGVHHGADCTELNLTKLWSSIQVN